MGWVTVELQHTLAHEMALEKVGYQTVGIYRHQEFRHNRPVEGAG